MALRRIVKRGDEALTKVCRSVDNFDRRLHLLLSDMADTLHKAQGVGLAAPQIGVLRRVVVVDVGDGLIELVNPKIIETKGEQKEIEGCLSCPGVCGITLRPNFVTVEAYDRDGRLFTISGEGLLARAFCHEIDHLDGKTIYETAIRILDQDEVSEYLEQIGEEE